MKLKTYCNFSSSWVIRVARFTINNLDEFAFDRYASHIIRTCLQCVAGVRVAANVARSKKATGGKGRYLYDVCNTFWINGPLPLVRIWC